MTTKKAVKTKPANPAKAGNKTAHAIRKKTALTQPRFNGRIISLDDVGCGLSEVFANQMAFSAFVRNWLKHADVDKVEINDVIRISEMNVSAMGALAEMQAVLENRRAGRARPASREAGQMSAVAPHRSHLSAIIPHLPATRDTGPSWLTQGYRPPDQGVLMRLSTVYFACAAIALLASIWRP
jgi:hypothetical protein